MKPEVIFNLDRCKGCGLCVHFCPREHLRISADLDSRSIHLAEVCPDNDCTACKICTLICPEAAIAIYREKPEEAK